MSTTLLTFFFWFDRDKVRLIELPKSIVASAACWALRAISLRLRNEMKRQVHETIMITAIRAAPVKIADSIVNGKSEVLKSYSSYQGSSLEIF
tara:strand:- start:154 stop:432 length:279 start_codon:yes stop_codon:yes gene_type:complete